MLEAETRAAEQVGGRGASGEVLLAFLKLGLTSFGGPIAHIGYFRGEFVARRGCSPSARSPTSSRSPSSCPDRRRARSASRSA